MANPRNTRKSPTNSKSNDKSQEDADMSTTEAPVTEAPVEEPTEAPAPEAPAAPAEPKEKVDHEGLLFQAIVTFGNDGNVEALQSVYRDVPAAARGKVQGVAMKRAMTEGGVDMEVLSSVLDAFNNLPTATKSRTAKPQVDDATLAGLRLFGLMKAYEALRSELGEPAHEQAVAWNSEGIPEEHSALTAKITENVVTASSKLGRGGGTRNSFTEKLADLIGRGALSEGDVLKGANGAEATVNADGTVTTSGQTFDNLSAASRVHRTKEDGKTTSTNGWDFWTFDGKPVGELRQS